MRSAISDRKLDSESLGLDLREDQDVVDQPEQRLVASSQVANGS